MPQTPYNAPVGVSYKNISGAGTITVKSGAGLLASINVNQAASAAAVTLYDNTAASGTKIGSIVYGAAATAPVSLPFGPNGGGINFNTGLVIVTSGSVDLTVAYR